jgi:hypothetical protein
MGANCTLQTELERFLSHSANRLAMMSQWVVKKCDVNVPYRVLLNTWIWQLMHSESVANLQNRQRYVLRVCLAHSFIAFNNIFMECQWRNSP